MGVTESKVLDAINDAISNEYDKAKCEYDNAYGNMMKIAKSIYLDDEVSMSYRRYFKHRKKYKHHERVADKAKKRMEEIETIESFVKNAVKNAV